MNISIEWIAVGALLWMVVITWRLLALETNSKGAPTHGEIADLRQQIAELMQQMGRMEERTQSMQHQMSVIYEHVLKDEK